MSTRAAPHPPDQPWRPKHNPWLIALTVTMATFMEVLDTSIANVSLPHIAGNLSASQDEATWVLTSYLVSNAIVLPLSAWFSSLFGRKRFYMGCVAIFTVSSFLCGLAPNLPILIFLRVLQGIGGGGLQPSEQAILADTFPPQKRGAAFAFYGVAVVMAPAIGPTLGGYITDNFTWRWIFFINVPVGILSLILTSRLVEDPPYLHRQQKGNIKLDYIGLSLIALGLGCLQVVLDKGQEEDWFGSHFILSLTIIAAVSLLVAVFWELRHKYPIIDLSLFKDRNFSFGSMLLFALGFVLFGSTVLLPLFLQNLLGYTAEQSGKVISPGGIGIMLLMPIVGFLVSRVSARYLVSLGFLISGAALLHMSGFNLNITFSQAMWARVWQASGLAFLFVPLNTAIYATVPREKNNNASGLINLARNLGGSFGISLVTTMLTRREQFHISRLTANLTPYDPQYRAMLVSISQALQQKGSSAAIAAKQAYGVLYERVIRQATTQSFLDIFFVLGIAMFCLIPFAMMLKKNDPHAGPSIGH
jgi:DHA2 family multidrug resistance protein